MNSASPPYTRTSFHWWVWTVDSGLWWSWRVFRVSNDMVFCMRLNTQQNTEWLRSANKSNHKPSQRLISGHKIQVNGSRRGIFLLMTDGDGLLAGWLAEDEPRSLGSWWFTGLSGYSVGHGQVMLWNTIIVLKTWPIFRTLLLIAALFIDPQFTKIQFGQFFFLHKSAPSPSPWYK